MQIELGKDVIASDGEKIGSVDRLVLDSETNELIKFVVQKGFFLPEDRIVDMEMVTNVDADGAIRLSVPSNDDRSLPPFVEETFRVATDDEVRHLGYGAYTGTVPHAPIWYAPVGTAGIHRPEDAPLFHGGEASSGIFETRDNLPDDAMTIDSGTNVVGSDGEKVGEVDEVIADQTGRVAGFIVKAGFIFTRDVQIPMSAVDQIGSDEIRLNITGESAEATYTI